MSRIKYEPPSRTFPFKIPKRLNKLSVPRRYIFETEEGMPKLTPTGTRLSAITGHVCAKNSDIAWPYVKRLLMLKKMYKNRFSPERLERIDRMTEAANSTIYAKLANCSVDLKKMDMREAKKRKAWSDSEWKKRMEYVTRIAGPKKEFTPAAVQRGKTKPLEDFLVRINKMTVKPDFKRYRRMSLEDWYRNPEKVEPAALKYKITARTLKLAVPRALPPAD